MTATGTASSLRRRDGYASYFERSGLPDTDHLVDGPIGYARRLIRYIRDDSTVRARVADRFGRAIAPSAERVAALRAEREATIAAALERHRVDEPEASDALDFGQAWSFALGRMVRPVEARETAEPAPVPLDPRPAMGPAEMIDAIAAAHGLTGDALRARCRRANVVRVRNLAAAVLAARGNSFRQAAKWLGGRDHSTLIHACQMFVDRDMADPALADTWQAMTEDRRETADAWLARQRERLWR